ncbi:MAG: hypothetical protein IH592_06390 [Bacteroidales bacterium]|nr:hypothetical protein [Bacteroidales bacterium]
MKPGSFLIVFASALLILILSGCGQKKKPAAADTQAGIEVTADQTAEPGNTESDTGGKGKPLGVKSGIIEYTYSGDKTGKSTQYFEDYGMKSAVYAEITSQGETSKGWTLTIGEDQYMWDLSNTGQGMKTKNPMIKMLAESSGKDILSYMAGMYEQMGLIKSGTETFQGKECTVFKGDLGKVLIWKGIMMKTEMNFGTMVSRQEVSSIKTNIPVDGKYFRLPGDITFSEMPGF